MSLLRLRHVTHRYPGALEPALYELDLDLAAGECLGIVGESGCGKSTLARVVTRLLQPDSGVVEIAGQDWAKIKTARLAPLYRHVQLVFQDTAAALSPRRTVAQSLREALCARGRVAPAQVQQSILTLLAQVGLDASLLQRFPHQLSGGQRQRVVIARALAVKPRILVADEPVAALDVSVQAQILNLLAQLSRDLNLAVLFISHDLAAVASLCQRIAVIYRGRLVECASTESLLRHPAHPYTARLLAAAHNPLDPDVAMASECATGSGVSAASEAHHAMSGCPYRGLCPQVMNQCFKGMPGRYEVGSQDTSNEPHWVRCYLHAASKEA